MTQRARRIAQTVLCLALGLVLTLDLLPVDSPSSVYANRADDAVPGEAIVMLRPGADIMTVALKARADIVNRIPGSQLYRLRTRDQTTRTLHALNANRDVTIVEPNWWLSIAEAEQFSLSFSGFVPFTTSIPITYTAQWPAARLGLATAHTRGATGRGVVVALLDTGVDADHPALTSRVLRGWNFIENNANTADQPDGLDNDGNGLVDEAVGHGTFVAGLVSLVAPEARILPERVLNSDGQGTVYDVASGIHAAVDAGAAIINLSLGTKHNSIALREAVDYAFRHGAIVVAAVGNHESARDTSTILYPARYPGVVAVGATDRNDALASFSNWRGDLDLVAPGVTVFSSFRHGGYAWMSGTSMAAAFTSGAAATVVGQHVDWTANDVVNRIKRTAANVVDVGSPQFQSKIAVGRIDVDAATR